MQPGLRRALQIFGTLLFAAAVTLFWFSRKPVVSADAAMGEEVYASHDCSDCHLGVQVLRQKREKKELGLIRVRKDWDELVKFLQADERHRSFNMISGDDRKNLSEYLRTLSPSP